MANDTDPMLRKHPDFVKVNDKEHTVLYKSPGSHRGSKGRSYDFIQAKTKEEATGLIEEGWSETEEEAHELAAELKKSRRKARVADDDDEADDVDPIDGAPTSGKTVKKKKAK